MQVLDALILIPRLLLPAPRWSLSLQHAFETPILNAAELFGGVHRREGVEQQDFLHVFGEICQ